MILSRYITKISAAALPLALALGATGCADEKFPGIQGDPKTVILHLGATATRADSPDNGVVVAEDDERNVTDLRYFLFPKYDTSGEFKTGLLNTPSAVELGNGKDYTLEDVKIGYYNVYVVANVPEAAGCTTEEQLRQTIIDHTEKLNSNYKKNGRLNLPMLAEAGVAKVSPDAGGSVSAELQFACAKVSYRLLFYANGDDRRNGNPASRPFGTNGYFVKSVSADGLTAETPLSLTGAELTSFPVSADSKDFGIPAYSTNWTDNGINARDKEDIVPDDATDVTFGGRYVASGVMYLPERYVEGSDTENGTVLTFDGYQTAADATYSAGGAMPANKGDHQYKLRIGHEGDGMWKLSRGTYYEVVAEVVNPQATELEATVKMADWTVHNMAGDMSHTVLTVNRTHASVNSLETDSIQYTTNAPAVTLGVPDEYKVDGKPLIAVVEVPGAAENMLHFAVNPEIPYEVFENQNRISRSGTVPVWIQAGNVRKYLDVDYDVSPLFTVSPDGAVIQYKEKGSDVSDEEYEEYLTRTFEYRTNLGGINIANVVSGNRYNSNNGTPVQDSDGLVQINIRKDGDSHGYIDVIVKKSPGNETVTYNLQATPVRDGYFHLGQTLQVDVKPTYDTYRIYFRAINDNQDDATFADYSGSVESMYFYNTDNGGKGKWGEVYYYLYTQMGQTIDGSIPKDWVWLFTGAYPGKAKTDTSNGWARYDISSTTKGICQSNDDGTYKNPKGGETLIIFANSDSGGSRHRMAFNNEPGIQLYDYEDKEGYYIFDPLCDPYSKVYDSRPEIVNVQYRLFTEKMIDRLEVEYGIDDNGKKFKLTLGEKFITNKEITDTDGKTWYMNEFYAQCPEGDYAKALKVYFKDGESTVLFGGRNFYNASNKGISRGIYENGEWRMGAIESSGVESTTRSIYLKASDWNKANLYAWIDDSNSNATWPGVEMTSLGNGWYKIDISKSYTKMIFNNGSGTQSGNLSIDANASSIYYEHNSGNNFSITSQRP